MTRYVSLIALLLIAGCVTTDDKKSLAHFDAQVAQNNPQTLNCGLQRTPVCHEGSCRCAHVPGRLPQHQMRHTPNRRQ